MAEDVITLAPVEEKTAAPEKTHRAYDYALLILTIFLVGLGLVFLYSTSSYTAEKQYGNPAFYFKKELTFAVLGLVLAVLLSFADYRLIIASLKNNYALNLTSLFHLGCYFLQFITLIPGIGVERYGARRWIYIPGIGQQFQPSEISKVSVIIFTAMICAIAPKMMGHFSGFIRANLLVMPLIALVAKEDLSTALVMAAIFIVICFVASKNFWLTVLEIGIGAGAGALYIFLGEGFRMSRVNAWKNVDTAEGAYQIRRGLYALASGGLTGKGLGAGSLKMGYVPEAHNDMIFSIICEEIGIIGASCIIFLYVLLLWRIYVVAIHAQDLFGSLLCIGVMTHIGVQVLMNIAVVTNSIPATGIALPFISYGGTALLFQFVEIALVLSVSNQIKTKG